jgi:hypothetical protein
MNPYRKSFGIWVPDKRLTDNRGFISPGTIGAVAGSRRRTAAGPQTASDNFDSYADASTLGGQGSWVGVTGTVKVIKPASDGRYMSSGASVAVARWSAGTWSGNQYSEVTLSAEAANGNYIGVAVRCQPSAVTLYYVYWTNNTMYLNRYLAGSLVGMTTAAATIAPGKVLRLEVTGTGSATRLSTKVDGSTVINSYDPGATYIDGGNPGVACYNGDTTKFGGTSWIASDL